MEKVLLNNAQLELINNDLYMTDQRFDDLKANSLSVYGTTAIQGGITITDDLTIGGNLTVNGTQTIINTETLSIEDPIILLNTNSASTPVSDSGIEVKRGGSNSAKLIWNETDDFWSAGMGTNLKRIALMNPSLTDGGVAVYSNFSKELQASSGLTYITELLTAPNIKISSMLTNSLVTTDVNQQLTTNVGLTYASNILTAPDIEISNLTADSLITTNTNKKLVTNTGLTYASSTLTTPDIKISNLTSTIIPFINSSKQFSNSDMYNVTNASGTNYIGIGTSNPVAKLHICQTSTNATDAFRVDDQASDTTFFRITETGQIVIMQQDPASYQTVLRVAKTNNSSDAIRFGVSTGGIGDISCLDGTGARGCQITSDTSSSNPNFFLGNVGVGTSNPSSKFHVQDNTNDCINITQSTAINKNAISRLWATYDGAKSLCGNAIIQLANKADASAANPDNCWYIGMHATAGANDFDPPLKIGFRGTTWGLPGDNDLLTILTNGRVGIGTASPNSQLHIGPSNVRSITAQNINNVGGFAYNSNILGFNMSTNTSSGVMSCYSDGANIKSAFIANQNGQLEFGNYAATSAVDYTGTYSDIGSSLTKMVISPSGSIGIGTSTPSNQAILDINSTTLCLKLPMLTSPTRNGFSTEGLFCYDTTLRAPVFRNNLGWIEQRNILEQLYYNISTGTTQTALTNTATDYRLSIESNMTSIPSTGNLFSNNASAYVNWKYNTGTNINSRYFKYILNISFYTDSTVSEKFSFSVYKNATFASNAYSSGGSVIASSYNQIHSQTTAGQSMTLQINFIDQTAQNDVYTLVVRYGSSGKKITVNHCNVICETYY